MLCSLVCDDGPLVIFFNVVRFVFVSHEVMRDMPDDKRGTPFPMISSVV